MQSNPKIKVPGGITKTNVGGETNLLKDGIKERKRVGENEDQRTSRATWNESIHPTPFFHLSRTRVTPGWPKAENIKIERKKKSEETTKSLEKIDAREQM